MPHDTFTYYLLKVGFMPPLRAHSVLQKNLVLPEPEPPDSVNIGLIIFSNIFFVKVL